MSPSDEAVFEFEAGHYTVRAGLSEFRGQQRIDLRQWVEPRDSPGADLIPTQKGINLPVSFLDELEEAVAALRAAVGKRAGSPKGRCMNSGTRHPRPAYVQQRQRERREGRRPGAGHDGAHHTVTSGSRPCDRPAWVPWTAFGIRFLRR
jgi:hypothetical protein